MFWIHTYKHTLTDMYKKKVKLSIVTNINLWKNICYILMWVICRTRNCRTFLFDKFTLHFDLIRLPHLLFIPYSAWCWKLTKKAKSFCCIFYLPFVSWQHQLHFSYYIFNKAVPCFIKQSIQCQFANRFVRQVTMYSRQVGHHNLLKC